MSPEREREEMFKTRRKSDGQGRVTLVDTGYIHCRGCMTPMFFADAHDGLPVNWEPRRAELAAKGDTCENCRYLKRLGGESAGSLGQPYFEE